MHEHTNFNGVALLFVPILCLHLALSFLLLNVLSTLVMLVWVQPLVIHIAITLKFNVVTSHLLANTGFITSSVHIAKLKVIGSIQTY